jgi:hypothetical protein
MALRAYDLLTGLAGADLGRSAGAIRVSVLALWRFALQFSFTF